MQEGGTEGRLSKPCPEDAFRNPAPETRFFDYVSAPMRNSESHDCSSQNLTAPAWRANGKAGWGLTNKQTNMVGILPKTLDEIQ